MYIKKVSHLPSQLRIFVFTFTVKRLRFYIYGALLHFALKVFTFTGPYYIFTLRGATHVIVQFIQVYSTQNICFNKTNQVCMKSAFFLYMHLEKKTLKHNVSLDTAVSVS